MEHLLTTQSLMALLTLTLLEIVLGIDNIIFIAILVAKIPQVELREKIRTLGISLALLIRIALLFSITWVMSLTQPLFTILNIIISGRDIILIVGGLFLLIKSTLEIHHKFEDAKNSDEKTLTSHASKNATSVLIQILLLDIVFSLDSVITAVGMVSEISIMIIAMIISMIIMLIFARSIGNFVEKHPTIKILALSFLLMIGLMLVAEGLGTHINKGYIYFAMFFSFLVEMININIRRKTK